MESDVKMKKEDKLTKENLQKKSKGQLISIIQLLKQQTVSQKTAILRRDGIIRNYQTHLNHIARKIKFLQTHPYATEITHREPTKRKKVKGDDQ